MKILITGGTGFIGSRLALSYLKEGCNVEVIGQLNNPVEIANSYELEKSGAKIHNISITDREAVFKVMTDFDLVFHLAAKQHEMNVPDQKFWDVNVEGTRNVLDAALHANIKKFIHGSTIGVYGQLDGKIDENSPLKPDNIYGITKLEGEKLVLSYKDKLPLAIVRIPEVYGPGDMRFVKLYKTIDNNLILTIGDGDNLHHLIFIDDLIEGFKKLATSEKASSDVFLFAGKETVSTNNIMDTIAIQLGKNAKRITLPFSIMWSIATIIEIVLRPLGIQPPLHRRRLDFFKKSFTLSSLKAQQAFGFSPKYSFNDGALQTTNWYKTKGLI